MFVAKTAQTQTQSSGTVEQPNGCRHIGAPEALRLAPGEHEPVAEGAPHQPQLSMEGMGGVAHDGLEFVPHPPLTTTSRLSSSCPSPELAFLTSLLTLLGSKALMPPPQHAPAKNSVLATKT